MNEEWRPIDGQPGYEVSSFGRVRSFKRRDKGHWIIDGEPQRILKPSGNGRGYLGCILVTSGKQTRVSIHRAVALAFLGPCPEGMEVCHNDGDKQNNRVENLRYASHGVNMWDHALHQNGLTGPEVLAFWSWLHEKRPVL